MTTTTWDGTARDVLVARDRPDGPGALTASLLFGRRAVLKIRRVPAQLFDVVMHPVLFTLIFTYLFGGALAGSPRDYLPRLVPGILVMTVVVMTGYTGSALAIDVERGVFDRFRMLPIWRPAILVGALLGDAVRYALASGVVVALGLALGLRPAGGVPGVLAAVLLVLVFAFGLSWIWTALGLVMKAPGAVLGVTQAVMYPLVFFSNVFVAPTTLPGWLETVVDLNPVTRLVTAVRGLMAGAAGGSGWEIVWVLAAAALLTAVFAPLTMWLFNRK